MKRLFILMMLFSLCFLPVFAGGQQEEAATDETVVEEPAAQTPAAEESAPAATVEPETTLIIWADETRASILEELGADFQAKYGVAVQIQQMGFGDIRDNIKVAAPAGEGPDIIVGAHDWLGELVSSGILAPLDLGTKKNDFLQSAIAGFTYDGELYGMPYAVENLAFVYNPDLVGEMPSSWAEVAEVAAELEAAGTVKHGFIRQEGDPYHFFPIQTAFGGYVFGVNPDGTYDAADVGIDSAGSIAAAEWLEMMVNEGHLPAGVDWDTYHTMFETGDAAMMITGPWAIDRLKSSGVSYRIAPFPEGGKPFLGVQGFMISAFSEEQILATAFLTEFVGQVEPMFTLYEKGGRAPALMAALDKVTDVDVAAFGAAGAEGLPMPAIPEMSAVWGSWGDAVTLIMQKQLSGEEAFRNAAEQIRNTLAGN